MLIVANWQRDISELMTSSINPYPDQSVPSQPSIPVGCGVFDEPTNNLLAFFFFKRNFLF